MAEAETMEMAADAPLINPIAEEAPQEDALIPVHDIPEEQAQSEDRLKRTGLAKLPSRIWLVVCYPYRRMSKRVSNMISAPKWESWVITLKKRFR